MTNMWFYIIIIGKKNAFDFGLFIAILISRDFQFVKKKMVIFVFKAKKKLKYNDRRVRVIVLGTNCSTKSI